MGSGAVDLPEASVGDLDWLMDVPCHVEFVLGGSTVTVRDCLDFAPDKVVRLSLSAGSDLHMRVEGVAIATGEVVIVEDQTALRVTRILPPAGPDSQ
jgi:flagellar motor switch/type III secretory pathway protein FliN